VQTPEVLRIQSLHKSWSHGEDGLHGGHGMVVLSMRLRRRNLRILQSATAVSFRYRELDAGPRQLAATAETRQCNFNASNMLCYVIKNMLCYVIST
jgi:hypothetical protein